MAKKKKKAKSTKKKVTKKKATKKKATKKKATKKKAKAKAKAKKAKPAKAKKASPKKVAKVKAVTPKTPATKVATPKTTKPQNTPATVAPTAHPLVGMTLPDLKMQDQNGTWVDLKNLGTNDRALVLYFYPKDDTPGCTQEACDFRDLSVDYKNKNVDVVGVSPDSVESHASFVNKHNLNFPLLSDPDQKLANIFKVWKLKKLMGREYMGVERSTFIFKNSKLVKGWQPVKVEEHAKVLLTEV